jgi:hypothetical protein
MCNVLSTLHEGGLLILHALYRCQAYKVGERLFPGADLTEDDLVDSLRANGFARSSIDVHVIPCPDNAQYGYAGILVASARKGLSTPVRLPPRWEAHPCLYNQTHFVGTSRRVERSPKGEPHTSKGRSSVTSRNDWAWQPPGETIEAIAAVLCAHWAAAKSQQQLFSLGTAGNWLRQLPWSHRLTTLRAAAGSSDRLPDPHPC